MVFLLTLLVASQLISVVLAGTSSSIEWGPCDPSVITNPALTCSFFDIPLDYHDPSVGHGRLALAKLNATGDRLGTVFLNPGGPGGSGLDTLNTLADLLSSLSGGLYDIVSWDPRGVGSLTTPGEIFCFDSPDEYNTFWNGTIELTGIEMTGNFSDPEDVQALLAQAPVMQAKYDELARRCLRHPSGKFLRYVGTAATARDIVALADALDGPGRPVNFVGTSYGSLLGMWLINMFPERVGRVIIDGIVNPTLLATEETATMWAFHELADADKAYEVFLTGCALAGPQGCPIASAEGQTAADIDATIQALLKQAHDAARRNASVPVTSEITRGRYLLLSVIESPGQAAIFANTTWPMLVAGVQSESGSEPFTSRRSMGGDQQNQTRSYSDEAILCGDSIDLRGTRMSEVFETVIAASRNTSEMFSVVWPAEFYACPFWPVRAVERYQGPFNKTLANKVMVVSNTFDPVTPPSEAEAVVALLGDNARLVQQDAFGHTSASEPSQCLDAVMFAYFVNGTLPEDNRTLCEVDMDFEIFPGVDTEAILAAMTSSHDMP
ncbi:alpha/beta-hydrolase [Trametes versicolor FP-101664 SS1]|uniref:alpha/beta-hydrolase n=1 Tax=Trametes versicolor (strain FP-101664) TaxID=717944 RepID=UPI0004622BBD|nr:alpha/beta-hydrolase [Trametes versicolor FP-101664 SS1]EIW56311.1 alpha/beta-hydrolase [Trametes versicolor FP-101664 SS1]